MHGHALRHGPPELYSYTSYSCTSLYSIQPLQHSSGAHTHPLTHTHTHTLTPALLAHIRFCFPHVCTLEPGLVLVWLGPSVFFTGSMRIYLNHSLNKHYTGGTRVTIRRQLFFAPIARVTRDHCQLPAPHCRLPETIARGATIAG